MMVSISHAPFADVTVTLSKDVLAEDAAEGTVTKSEGITLGDKASYAFSKDTKVHPETPGVLSFSCGTNEETTATMLKVTLSGTDKDCFADNVSGEITVVPKEAGDAPTSADGITCTQVTENAKVSTTSVTGVCPDYGEAWIQFTPGTESSTFANADDVSAAYTEFMGNYTDLRMYKEP